MMFDNTVYIKSNYDGWGCITSWSGRLSEGTRLPLGVVTAALFLSHYYIVKL